MKNFLRIVCALLLGAGMAAGADISIFGDWLESVTASSLVNGAGTGIQTPQSVSGVTVLTINNASGPWRVKARRSSSQWNGNLTLWVKRTSDGAGSGTIAGGSAYVELGTTDVEIFSGTDARSNISLQYKLTGLTTAVPPNSYTSSIIFTVQ